jgi:hypothetical protein
MVSPYKAIFLLPPNSEKTLGDDGWEFSSPGRLSQELLLSLAKTLDLEKGRSYLGMEVYEGAGLKLTAITDERGIENIYIQTWSRPKEDVVECIRREDVEVFVPC